MLQDGIVTVSLIPTLLQYVLEQCYVKEKQFFFGKKMMLQYMKKKVVAPT